MRVAPGSMRLSVAARTPNCDAWRKARVYSLEAIGRLHRPQRAVQPPAVALQIEQIGIARWGQRSNRLEGRTRLVEPSPYLVEH